MQKCLWRCTRSPYLITVSLGEEYCLNHCQWSEFRIIIPYDHKLITYNSSQAWWMDSPPLGHVVRGDDLRC